MFIILAKDFILILYIIPYQQYDFLAPVMMSHYILFTWYFIYNLVRLGYPIWTLPKVFVIALMLCISNVVFVWLTMIDADEESYTIGRECALTFVSFGFFLLFIVIGQWIYYVWNQVDETTDILTFLKFIQTSIFVFFFVIYISAAWYVLFSIDISPEWGSTYGVGYLTFWTYVVSGCTAGVSVISGRVSKFGSIMFANVSYIYDILFYYI